MLHSLHLHHHHLDLRQTGQAGQAPSSHIFWCNASHLAPSTHVSALRQSRPLHIALKGTLTCSASLIASTRFFKFSGIGTQLFTDSCGVDCTTSAISLPVYTSRILILCLCRFHRGQVAAILPSILCLPCPDWLPATRPDWRRWGAFQTT